MVKSRMLIVVVALVSLSLVTNVYSASRKEMQARYGTRSQRPKINYNKSYKRPQAPTMPKYRKTVIDGKLVTVIDKSDTVNWEKYEKAKVTNATEKKYDSDRDGWLSKEEAQKMTRDGYSLKKAEENKETGKAEEAAKADTGKKAAK